MCRPRRHTAPTAPTGLTKTAATVSSVSLSWTASTDNVGVAGYSLTRNGVAAGTTATRTTTFTGLACGTTYTLGVAAYDAAGNTSSRTTLSGATSACAPAGVPRHPRHPRASPSTRPPRRRSHCRGVHRRQRRRHRVRPLRHRIRDGRSDVDVRRGTRLRALVHRAGRCVRRRRQPLGQGIGHRIDAGLLGRRGRNGQRLLSTRAVIRPAFEATRRNRVRASTRHSRSPRRVTWSRSPAAPIPVSRSPSLPRRQP